MADSDPKVMALVERELKKNPSVTNAELFEKAKKLNRAVGRLSTRQFHATYPLQVKRRMKPARRRAGAKKPAPKKTRQRASRKPAASRAKGRSGNGADREALRAVFLDFAQELTASDDRGAIVKALASVDGYVARAMKVAGG